MRYVRIALLSAAAIWLLPFATPAIAEMGHPSGCVGCPPVEIAAPTEGSFREGASAVGPVLKPGFPSGTTALAPTPGIEGRPLAKRCRAMVWDPRQYHVVCR
jgi:hypothetical protein